MSDIGSIALAALTLAQVATLATSVYLHRPLAHRALAVHPDAPPAIDGESEHVLALEPRVAKLLAWPRESAGHRRRLPLFRSHGIPDGGMVYHAFTDRDGDPHSPRLKGIWHIQLLNGALDLGPIGCARGA